MTGLAILYARPFIAHHMIRAQLIEDDEGAFSSAANNTKEINEDCHCFHLRLFYYNKRLIAVQVNDHILYTLCDM